MALNFGYHVLKLVRRNLDVYKSTIKENLLVLPLKVFTKKEVLLLAMWHYTCTKKMR